DKNGVAAISWILEERWKKPLDEEWKTQGPGLSLGSFDRGEMPPDVIDTVDGIQIIFSAKNPSIFVGKTVDFKDGRFLLRD
ncbi:MAG: hypothetical protein JO273_19125, partial [Methylobacteriaceae bacterium]|nr:hypothetical protein [Methylobacteriaceae bacterium]